MSFMLPGSSRIRASSMVIGESFLLPPSMRDWLPAGHLVWFILDAVEELDLPTFLTLAPRRLGEGRLPAQDGGGAVALCLLHRGPLLPGDRTTRSSCGGRFLRGWPVNGATPNFCWCPYLALLLTGKTLSNELLYLLRAFTEPGR